MKNVFRFLPAVLIGLVAFMIISRMKSGAKADVSAVFPKTVSLAQAAGLSAKDGKPVLAFATADWCGPCQNLKKNALSDSEVANWIKTNTHAVYLDGTSGLPSEAGSLNIEGFPTLIMLKSGKEVSRTVGVVPKDQLLSWLKSAVAASAASSSAANPS
jgi:thioredoxin 1